MNKRSVAAALVLALTQVAPARAELMLDLSIIDPIRTYGTPTTQFPASYSFSFQATLTNDPASTEIFYGSYDNPPYYTLMSDLVEASCCDSSDGFGVPLPISSDTPFFYGPPPGPSDFFGQFTDGHFELSGLRRRMTH